ncbi:MAG: hypothetical protein ABI557_00700 [Aureliella sp.]
MHDFELKRLGLLMEAEPGNSQEVGGGTPPVMTRHGWMILYHGVHATIGFKKGSGTLVQSTLRAVLAMAPDPFLKPGKHLCYSAGVMILSKEHPRTILYRSAAPSLTPILPRERDGVVENVVFPTGIDCRNDIGQPDRFDIYYGMADSRIGVASMTIPQRLPTTPLPRVDAPNAIVAVVPQPAEAIA